MFPFEINDWEQGARWAWRIAGIPATGHCVTPLTINTCRVTFTIPAWAPFYLPVCRAALRKLNRLRPLARYTLEFPRSRTTAKIPWHRDAPRTLSRHPEAARPMKLKDWIRDVRGKRPTEEVYVDFAEVPTEPEGPYRARMTVAAHQRAPEGIDVNEREVVTGQVQLLYRMSCPCGHRWDALDFQRMSLCAQCGRAVLVDPPERPAD